MPKTFGTPCIIDQRFSTGGPRKSVYISNRRGGVVVRASALQSVD